MPHDIAIVKIFLVVLVVLALLIMLTYEYDHKR